MTSPPVSSPLKILFLSSEASPFSGAGKQADLTSALARAMKKIGHEVRLVTPRYTSVRERRFGLRDISRLRDLKVRVGADLYEVAVKSAFIPGSKVQVYFINQPVVFRGLPAVGSEVSPLVSAALLNHGALQLASLLGWIPEIIYACGWSAAPVARLVRDNPLYREIFARSRTILHLFSDSNEPIFPVGDFARTGLANLTSRNKVRPTSLGLEVADLVITGKQAIGGILEYLCLGSGAGEGQRKARDDSRPSKAHLGLREANKAAVQRRLGLPATPTIPLIALTPWASDLADHRALKRLEVEIPSLPAQFVALGEEETLVRRFALRWSQQFPAKVAMLSGGGGEQLRQLESAADIALIAGSTAPDGLHPVRGLLGGTVPVVAGHIGGHAMMIEDFDPGQGRGNGFRFEAGDETGMVDAIKRAIEAYGNPQTWGNIQQRAMSLDYCWEQVARYLARDFRELMNSRRD